MSHFTTLVVIHGASDLAAAAEEAERMLAPFDEGLEVEPYKSYEEGEPESYWAVDTLRKDAGLTDPVTWSKIAEASNRLWADEDEGERQYVDELGMYQMSTYNPKSQWDWYQLGGRWTGYWPMKAGLAAVAALGQASWAREDNPADPGTADIARKEDIDFEYKQRQATIDAEELYAKFEAVVASVADQRYVAWSTIREAHGSDIDAARREYGAQPIIQAYRANREMPMMDGPEYFLFGEENAHERFVARARRSAFSTFAVLDSEGWHEKGSMGWWGMVSNERTQEEWDKAFAEMLDNLPGDTWLAVYDLHI